MKSVFSDIFGNACNDKCIYCILSYRESPECEALCVSKRVFRSWNLVSLPRILFKRELDICNSYVYNIIVLKTWNTYKYSDIYIYIYTYIYHLYALHQQISRRYLCPPYEFRPFTSPSSDVGDGRLAQASNFMPSWGPFAILHPRNGDW